MAAGLRRLGAATSAPLLRRLAPRLAAFGSAAAARLDYDEEYYEERDRLEPKPALDAAGWWVPPREVQWVVIGDRAAKRNFYAERLSKLLEVPHISMGSLVRQELNPSSSLYKQIAKAVNEGKLVHEDIVFGLLSKRLEEGYHRGESGFILDGIPRTRIQAEILDQIADVDLVVNLKNTGEELSPKKNLGTGSLSAVNLNHESTELFRENLAIETEENNALEDYYRKQRKIVDFEATGAPGETWQGLLAALHLQHINAVSSSSQKLTA